MQKWCEFILFVGKDDHNQIQNSGISRAAYFSCHFLNAYKTHFTFNIKFYLNSLCRCTWARLPHWQSYAVGNIVRRIIECGSKSGCENRRKDAENTTLAHSYDIQFYCENSKILLSIVPKIDLYLEYVWVCVFAHSTALTTFDWVEAKKNRSRRRKKRRKQIDLNLILGRKRLDHVCCVDCVLWVPRRAMEFASIFGSVSVCSKSRAYKSAISNWINTINYPRSNFTIATFHWLMTAKQTEVCSQFHTTQHNTIYRQHVRILVQCQPQSFAISHSVSHLSCPDLHHNLYK